MKDIVSSVSIGKLDKNLVVDLIKEEEDFEEGEGATDIPITMTTSGKITHIQLDGKITGKETFVNKKLLGYCNANFKTKEEIDKCLQTKGDIVQK